MKRIAFLLAASLLLLGFMTSCTPEEPLAQLEQEEAVEMIQAALQTQTGGLEEILIDVADMLDSLDFNLTCDSLYSKDFDYAYTGPNLRASYDAGWTFFLACTRFGTPDSADFTLFSEGDYGTRRIESEDSTSFTGTMGGLKLSVPDLILNGDFVRGGSQEVDGRNGIVLANSLLNIQLTNVKVNKYNGQGISSGTGAFTLTGDASGNPFSYTGTITFLGNKTATLTINGTSYPLDWN